MSQTQPPIVYFGSDDFSAVVLQRLIADGWPIAAVVTQPDRTAGRGRQVTVSPIKQLTIEHDLPVWQPERVTEIETKLNKLDVQYGVLASYGKLIPDSTLQAFPGGIVNVHPSLLPHYRGPTPIETAILRGDTTTGVTLMRLTTEMDAGPIYAQTEVALTRTETRPQLYTQLAAVGADLLAQHLPEIVSGRLTPTEQPETGISYTKLIKKEEGQIDWSKSATQLERQIRAYLGWPGSRTTLNDREVIVTDAHVLGDTEDASSQLVHATDDGRLVIDQLKPAGRREMTASEFLAGQRSQQL